MSTMAQLLRVSKAPGTRWFGKPGVPFVRAATITRPLNTGKALHRDGYAVQDCDLDHVWLTRYEHINVYGPYRFGSEEARKREE
jgi:hypothetical protein